MNYSTDNTRIVEKFDLVTPEEVISKYPLDDSIAKLVYGTRNKISQILHGKDDRIVAVVGPCSIHDQKSAIEYANLLNNIKNSLIYQKKKLQSGTLLALLVKSYSRNQSLLIMKQSQL